MPHDHNSLGIINHDYPAFLNDPKIEKILRDFATYSGLDKFYLAGGFIIDKLFYPKRISNDIDLSVYGFEYFHRTLVNLNNSGDVAEVSEFTRNLITIGKYIDFSVEDQKYDVVFLPDVMFSGLVSPECPLIEYPSGHLIEQGPNIQAHKDKTIEFTRPIATENKQTLLARFIHSACKYDFPLSHQKNQATLHLLRESFDHRDPKELLPIELDSMDKELISRIKKATSQPNQRWQEVKENLIQLEFDRVLSDNVWKTVLSY